MGTLVKKQLAECFSWLYKNNKTGEIRSKKGIIAVSLFWFVLLFGIIGAMFGGLGILICKPFVDMDLGWMYWCVMSLSGVTFGVLGSVFNTFGVLYQAKDNDLLLSMPVPVYKILISRLSGVYFMGLMYLMVAMIPTVVVWFVYSKQTVLSVIYSLVIPFVLSLLTLVLSAVLGFLVANISARLKNKGFLTVVASLVFIFVYFYFCSNINNVIIGLLENAQKYSEGLKKLYPFYQMGLAAEGNTLSMLIFVGIVAVLLGIVYLILSATFLKLVIVKKGEKTAKYQDKALKAGTLMGALFKKELSRFVGSANYMLNCGLGIVFMPVLAVVLVYYSEAIHDILSDFPGFVAYVPLVIVAVICMVSTMNDITAPSVSLEGKNMWLLKSYPIPVKTVIFAKLLLHIVLTAVPVAILVVTAELVFELDSISAVLIPVVTLLFIVFSGEAGLYIGIKTANLNWTNEVIPIKQNLGVLFALLLGWVTVIILGAVYFLCRSIVQPNMYLVIVTALLLALCAVMYRLLVTKGAEQLEKLN